MAVLLVLLAFTQGSLAAPQGGGDRDEVPDVLTPWADEATLHFHGLSARPLTGGGVVRRVSKSMWVGGRFLLPVYGGGVYAGELFARRFFTPEKPSSMYLEADATTWFGRDLLAPAGSVTLGVRTCVLPRIAMGGSMGPTLFPAAANPDTFYVPIGPVGLTVRMYAEIDFLL